MIEALKLFDPYNRQARLYPALLTLLPVVLALLAWFPEPLLGSVGGAALTVIAVCGGLYLLADIARLRGRRIEPGLVREWGGWPSTRLLRHGDGDLPKVTKDRYCAFLASRIGVGWPDAATEASDPTSADEVYRSATDWLREQTRKADFGRLLAENTTYGFRRNLLGLRPIGISVATASLVFLAVALGYRHGWSLSAAWQAIGQGGYELALVAAAVALVALLLWLLGVRKTWVKQAGDDYARALLACWDAL